MWTSPSWTEREKCAGTLLFPGGLIGAYAWLVTPTASKICEGVLGHGHLTCTTAGFLIPLVPWILVEVVLVLVPLAVAAYLYLRARAA